MRWLDLRQKRNHSNRRTRNYIDLAEAALAFDPTTTSSPSRIQESSRVNSDSSSSGICSSSNLFLLLFVLPTAPLCSAPSHLVSKDGLHVGSRPCFGHIASHPINESSTRRFQIGILPHHQTIVGVIIVACGIVVVDLHSILIDSFPVSYFPFGASLLTASNAVAVACAPHPHLL